MRRGNFITPQTGMVAFQINLTTKSPEMATFAYSNLTQSLTNGTFKKLLQSYNQTYLQFVTTIKNNMFCTGDTFKCPPVSSQSKQAPLKAVNYVYSEHSILVVRNFLSQGHDILLFEIFVYTAQFCFLFAERLCCGSYGGLSDGLFGMEHKV